ncbi:hypothetical protein Tco_1224886 [Tanacetum coccineum]
MPTEIELTLEQTQQGVSYEVSVSIEGVRRKRFYTSAGNPVKEILLKLNLLDHRILKDGGEVKEFQEIKNGMSMSVHKSQDHKMTKSQDGEMRLCLVDDLTVLKITSLLTSKDKGTSSSLKSKITTIYLQEKVKFTS